MNEDTVRGQHQQQPLPNDEKWFLLGSLSYALTRFEGARMAEAGYPEDEITQYVIKHLDQILADYFGQPLTTEDLKKIAHVMETTHKAMQEAFAKTTTW